MKACKSPGCCAMAADDSNWCAIHVAYTVRQQGDVAIMCCSCGEPIRIGQRWFIRDEGSIHARDACLMKPRDTWPTFTHRAKNFGKVSAVVVSAFALFFQLLTVTSYAALVGGNVADVVATARALDSGAAHESNPLIGSSMGRIVATKALTVAVATIAMRALETHRHPRAAAIIGIVGGVVGFGAAVHNSSLIH